MFEHDLKDLMMDRIARTDKMNRFFRTNDGVNELTHRIIGCAMEVHNSLGNGFQEVHKTQAINYLEAYGIADGLLMNFGGRSLEFKRLYNKKLVRPAFSNPVHPKNSVHRVQKKGGGHEK